jgi:hypothetical protein
MAIKIAPVSLGDFIKNPIAGMLFLVCLGIGYLYVDNRNNFQAQIEKCDIRVQDLEKKVDNLTIRLQKSDSTLARTAARLEFLNELARIQQNN